MIGFIVKLVLVMLPLNALAQGTILLKATLGDPEFADKSQTRVELLETGEIVQPDSDGRFNLTLPQDSIWNICVTAPGKEKCYLLSYYGEDSVFSVNILDVGRLTWFADSAVVAEPLDSAQAKALANDTLGVDEPLAVQQKQNTELRKVVVQLRRRPRRKMGESVVSARAIKRLPGLAEADVIRSLQALPGVVASSDFSTKIYVRGGGADQNLFLLDNGVVYSPVHFFGLFSTFLVEGIDDVKFYKGGFGPQYGNRLSSVVDISSRQGGSDTADSWFDKSSIKVSTFASQAHTEGRQGSVRWLVAGRTTYIKEVLGALNDAGVTDFELDYRFTDVQSHLRYDLGEDRYAAMTIYGGRDVLNFDPLAVDWGNLVIPLNLNWRLRPDLVSTTSLSYSSFDQSFSLQDIFLLYNDIQSWNLRQLLQQDLDAIQQIQYGIDFTYFDITFRNEQRTVQENFVDRNKFMLYAAFYNHTWKPDPLEITLGLRLNYQDLAEHFGLEPRASLRWILPNHQSLSFHAGYYLQYINSIIFGDQETLNEFYYPARKATLRTIKPASSLLLSAGYGVENLWDTWSFSFETYYKTQNRLLAFAPEEMGEKLAEAGAQFNSLADGFKEGEGYSLGYEISLRQGEGAINGGVSWSQGLSVLLEQYDTLAYYPDWHQPYAFKGDLNINWKGSDGLWPHKKKGRYLRSSLQVKYASGLPFTERLGYYRAHNIDQSGGEGAGGPNPEFDDGIAVPQGNRNTDLQPPYFRFDIKAIDMGRENKWNFSWTILNITNHENIFLYTYDTATNPPTPNKITQFPFFPILLNYEYYF